MVRGALIPMFAPARRVSSHYSRSPASWPRESDLGPASRGRWQAGHPPGTPSPVRSTSVPPAPLRFGAAFDRDAVAAERMGGAAKEEVVEEAYGVRDVGLAIAVEIEEGHVPPGGNSSIPAGERVHGGGEQVIEEVDAV